MLNLTTLQSLPPELLDRIVSRFETAHTLVSLARTSKYLYEYVKKSGFRVFVQNTFPHASTPPQWAQAARGLTRLAKAWEQKALTASILRPPVRTGRPATGHSRSNDRGAGRSSIGFQPVLDCYEDWPGGAWRSRREVLACGAGPQLVVRVRSDCIQPYDAVDERYVRDDRARWMTGGDDQYREGPDDITAVRLLRPHQCALPDDMSVELVVGRWNGELRRVRVTPQGTTTVARYDTGGQPVRCADLSSAAAPFLACTAEATVRLFSVGVPDPPNPSNPTPPIDTLAPPSPDRANRVWAPRFLSSRRLAIGRGPSATPLAVHDVGPTGIRPEPVFSAPATTGSGRDAAYAITPLPRPHSDSLLLAGMHSGALLLHDLRAPPAAGPAARYDDPVDPLAPIYALLPVGSPNRVLAGSARHGTVKVFDLRRPPPRNYSLFLPNPRGRQRGGGGSLESPVYALAAASAGAPTWYAGVQGAVVQVDVSAWVGPALGPAAAAVPGAVRRATGPHGLGLIEHPADPSGSMHLRRQAYAPEGLDARFKAVEGWDPRWRQYARDGRPGRRSADDGGCRNQ